MSVPKNPADNQKPFVLPAKSPTSSKPQVSIRYIRADKIEMKPIPWLWPQYIPLGKTTNLNGLPGQGKSMATCSLTACVTTGRDYPDGSKNTMSPGEVLFLATEDDASSVIVPRLKVAGADLSKVHIINSAFTHAGDGREVEDREVALDTDRNAILQIFADHPEIRLFVVDPITNHLGTKSHIKENEIRQLLKPLEKQGVSNIIVC